MESRYKNLMSSELWEFLSNIPKDETSRYTIMGNKNFDLGEYDTAIENYSSAIELNHSNITAIYYRGHCYNNLEKFENAVSDSTKVIFLKPEFIKAYLYRGNARASIQTYSQLKAAISDYTVVINSDIKDGTVFMLRGYCNLLLKKENFAFQDWRMAKKLGAAKETEENWQRDFFK
jgi:tetratricopeptide (TPR) repeat protein